MIDADFPGIWKLNQGSMDKTKVVTNCLWMFRCKLNTSADITFLGIIVS